MTVEINQFWNLLTESKLASSAVVQSLFSEFLAQNSVPRNTESLAQWILQRGQLSPYQAEFLLAGHSGPFFYGSYVISEKIPAGPLAGNFVGRHRVTGYPVLLQFLAGNQVSDLARWRRLEAEASLLSRIEHPTWCALFETVALSEYRFLVSELPAGKPVSQRLPPKSRLPWKQACAVLAQVSQALDCLHQQGRVHGSLTTDCLWLQSSGAAQLRLELLDEVVDAQGNPAGGWTESPDDYLAPEVNQPFERSVRSDLYAVGGLLFRLITGRTFVQGNSPAEKKKFHRSAKLPSLEKYELPGELNALLRQLLEKDPQLRPGTAAEVANLLGLLAGHSELAERSRNPQREAYLQSYREVIPGLTSFADQLPEIATGQETSSALAATEGIRIVSAPAAAADPETRIALAREKALQRKRSAWRMPALVAAGLALFALSLGWLAYVGYGTRVADTGNPSGDPGSTPTSPAGTNADASSAAPRPGNTTEVAVIQQLVEDDGDRLWETPTVGLPAVADYLPAAPRILLQVRWAQLLSEPEAARILAGFGARFQELVQGYLKQSGVESGQVERLTVSWHDAPETGYLPFGIIQLEEPVPLKTLLENWGAPAEVSPAAEGLAYFQGAENRAYLVLSQDAAADRSAGAEHNAASPAEEPAFESTAMVTRFAWGDPELIRQVADAARGVPLSGSLARLQSWTDRDRHLTLTWLRPSLFNDRGQAWMGSPLLPFNRELRVMIPDQVRGGLVSFHIADGNYFEFRFDRVVDLSATELKDQLVEDLRSRREMLTQLVARIRPNEYWNRVQVKYAGMLADVSRNLRWGIESGEVVGNVWLPEMAAHNLIAASELVTAFAAGSASASPSPQREVPQTIEALLAAKRDLDVANPPDLNVLMADLQKEIESDYGNLPFQWSIKLLGGDLEKEGITKNQRPGELVMSQKSLAEILTSIMISANPAKDISGPGDPNCKLIWVLAEDPDQPGQQAILITTRAAAAEKGYTLPPPFRGSERP